MFFQSCKKLLDSFIINHPKDDMETFKKNLQIFLNENKNTEYHVIENNKIKINILKINRSKEDKNENRKVILYSYGNMCSISSIITQNKIERFYKLPHDIDIVFYDYPGYCPGYEHNIENFEEECYIFITSVYNWLIKSGYKHYNLYIMGISLGSGPSIDLATKYNHKGLILLCPLKSILDIDMVKYDILKSVLNYVTGNMFCNLDKLQNIDISKLNDKTLFIHGSDDTLINCTHSKEMKDIIGSSADCYIIEKGTHINLFDFPQVYEIIDKFTS